MRHAGRRSMSLRNGLIVFLVVGVLASLGMYWNQRSIEYVMRDGYATTGKITSAAIISSRFPFVFDGVWPRYVDESLAVGLQWTGKDGVQREHKGIAVSAAYAARIMVGNQVRLLTIPIEVIDDDSSLPVIVEDLGDHLNHVRSMFKFMLGGTGICAVLLALVIGWQTWSAHGRGPGRTSAAPGSRRPVPFSLAVLAIAMVVFGGYMMVNSYAEQRTLNEILEHGDEATADLTRAYGEVNKAGEAPSYLVTLAWTDGNGQRRTYGPTHISPAFWGQITRNGVQTVRQARIRYLPGRPDARPLIVDDAAEHQYQDGIGVKAGAVFLAFGLLLAGVIALRYRARPSA
ncbi:hypothetical protein XH99_20100 [Bradyrhizobium nanningense]|uniref:DUF3592 domain-containing protein n=2 Tax=Bradyrhizobium nanningense TaxID=1325118 RepID=A0A4Q0S192_9BRAD|nr:hypothetical protein XH84_35705 [Bradyrhizobium nanningense]RXH26659.1 hypothetical protein XH99_20100 [Bradyrhizobium nanningense]